MERESFENEDIAALMNEHFVCIKVDREERPDLDDIYMAATMALNQGQGGWPMTVFLTPEQQPFFAGTYFPPDDRYGRPGFPHAAEAHRGALGRRERDAHPRAGRRRRRAPAPGRRRRARRRRWARPSSTARRRSSPADFDARFGGFGRAPKFPPSGALLLLLRVHRRDRRRARARDGHARRSTRWRAAACTTSSAAASTATPWTSAGWCRTSRRCCTTTRSSRASTWRRTR